MKRKNRWLALTLALCMAVPNAVFGMPADNSISAVQAAEPTGEDAVFGSVAAVDVDKLMAEAELAEVFTGEDQKFDGTRVVDVSDTAEAVHGVNTGSIILRFKADSSNNTGMLLATKVKGEAPSSSLDAQSERSSVFFMKENGRMFRFVYSHTRAGWTHTFTDGYWHTVVLSSLPSGKMMRLTIDGIEVWSNTAAVNQGMFAKQTALDEVTIGACLDANGNTVNGFKGEISHVIVTSQEITDAQAVAISKAGCSVPVTGGSDIKQMFTSEVADTSWLFTGGADVKGGFEQTRGERNYSAMFEKYDRGGSSGSFSVNRQRFVVNAGKEGQTLSDIVETYQERIAAYKPKAAVYLVGSDDWKQGEEKIAEFKENLKIFIENSLDLREGDQGFAVIQKPFAVKDADDNALIEKYCEAVDAVIKTYEDDAAKFGRIVVVDHYTKTKNDTSFIANGVDENGRLTADGHMVIGRQFTVAVSGCTEAAFNNSNAVSAKTEVPMPETYLDVTPEVTAAADSLQVEIPAGNGSSWTYELDMEGTIVSGTADSDDFTIEGLAAGKAYTLTIQSQDGQTQLSTVKGTIAEGEKAAENALTESEMNEYQKEIAEKISGEEPLTWLFMGDSITHATTTYGYDGVVQVVEDYVANVLDRKDDIVVNAGVNNAHTQHTIEQIQYRMKNYTPDILAIQLGTNDAIYFDDRADGATGAAMGDGYQNGVVAMGYEDKFEKYRVEMQEIIDTAKEINPDVTVILRSPTPSLDGRHVNQRDVKLYVEEMKALAEKNDCMFIDQYTNIQEAVNTYSWMGLKDNSFFFTDTLHPGTNGHRIMAHLFIEACGFDTTDNPVTNLFYDMPITDATGSVEPAVEATADKIAVSETALEEAAGTAYGDMILSAVSADSGQTYEVTVKDSADYAVIENLPTDTSYEVTVKALEKASAKYVTFAAQTVTLRSDAESAVSIVLDNTAAEDLSAGAAVANVSVGVLAPSGDYTFTLCDGEGDTHNDYFAIVDGQLVIKKILTKGNTYQIRIKAVSGDNAGEAAFEIKAEGVRVEIPVSEMTATAGDYEPNGGASEGPASLAIDGNSSTMWHTDWDNGPNHNNHWLQLELKEVYEVDGFRYQPRQSGKNGLITAYEIYVSMDGETWTKAAEGSWAADSSWKEVNFDAVEAKYVKLQTIEASSDQSVKFASAAEVRVTGTLVGEGGGEVVCTHTNTELVNAKEATCTEEGYTGDTVCKDCEETIEAGETIEKLAHEMGEWTVVKEATVDEEGLEERTCANCTHKEERTVEKLDKPTDPDQPTEFVNPFEDVTEADYFYDSVAWAVQNNVTAGITPTTFEPYTECNRGQIVLFLYRAMKGTAAEIENPFTDVSEADYCYDAVLWAVENGITTGITATTFEPWKSCTRAEIVTFLWRAMGSEAVETDKAFPDVNEADFFYDAVAWAVENGVTQGRNDGSFGAWLGCWRADAVTFIQRAVK